MTKRYRRYEWDKLQNLGSSRLVQLTVVIPVIGYLLLFSNELSNYFILVVDRESASPQFWRLYMLYFGFCLLAVASGIFSWRCPDEVKAHGAGFVFLEKEAPAIGEARFDRIKDTVVRARFNAAYPKSIYTIDEVKKLTGNMAQDASRMQELVRAWIKEVEFQSRNDVLMQYFVELKQRDKPWRIAVRTLYDVGFVFLAAPTAHVFVSVVREFAQIVSEAPGAVR